jgi:hypothetical protein
MKHAGSLKVKRAFLSLILLSSSFLLSGTPIASAATVGTGSCVQTVDNASDVAVTSSGGYCYVAFKAGTRTWTLPANVVLADFFAVGGGGSGGSRHGGGGGAGGLVRGSSISTSGVVSMNITVGDGAASPSRTSGLNYINGVSGSNTVIAKNSGSGAFTTITAYGGGGGTAGGLAPQNGGSGGGSQSASVSTSTGGQGNSGGTGGYDGSNYFAGGGGGAAAAGGNGSSSGGGGGGTGGIWISAFTTTIASALNLTLDLTRQTSGSQFYFAGGGGGGITPATTPGAGGLGGGGAAGNGNSTGVSGLANSGGGGGASGCCDGGQAGAGGSGVVIIRYLLPIFSNSATASIAENTALSTNAATITVSESSTITIRPVLDSSFFTVVFVDSVTARIRFIASPDFEARADSGGNNEYDLTIRATLLSGNYSESSLKITVTDVIETAVLGTPSLSGSPSKGRSVTITVTSDTPGTMRFFFAGKKIPSCLARATSGSYPNYSATCSWIPITSGLLPIYATLTPTDVMLSAVTSASTIKFVSRRAGLR